MLLCLSLCLSQRFTFCFSVSCLMSKFNNLCLYVICDNYFFVRSVLKLLNFQIFLFLLNSNINFSQISRGFNFSNYFSLFCRFYLDDFMSSLIIDLFIISSVSFDFDLLLNLLCISVPLSLDSCCWQFNFVCLGYFFRFLFWNDSFLMNNGFSGSLVFYFFLRL